MARGRSFKSQVLKPVVVTEKFINIDLYHLFCRLLGLSKYEKEIDGEDKIKAWKAMLRDDIVHEYEYKSKL